jgi:hypothetical protein
MFRNRLGDKRGDDSQASAICLSGSAFKLGTAPGTVFHPREDCGKQDGQATVASDPWHHEQHLIGLASPPVGHFIL